ncbi:hypothetical protein [Streptomyces sp. x-80]|jgi:hypothetical protein|uniref:hypothetical protein n=1 Tax=Streptomyces sp. x-80 TaxID=2789282 RepID=UPI00397EA83C
MTQERYALLAQHAGPWLEEFRDAPVPVGTDTGYEIRALYIAVAWDGTAIYCGRTRPRRPLRSGAAAARIGQHLREESKRAQWTAYWVLPLRADTPDAEVDRLEAVVAPSLGLPRRRRSRRRRLT